MWISGNFRWNNDETLVKWRSWELYTTPHTNKNSEVYTAPHMHKNIQNPVLLVVVVACCCCNLLSRHFPPPLENLPLGEGLRGNLLRPITILIEMLFWTKRFVCESGQNRIVNIIFEQKWHLLSKMQSCESGETLWLIEETVFRCSL